MEPLDDKELNQLLRKWEAPAAPADLRVAKKRSPRSLWNWLWNGRIHVPVPVGAAIAVIAVAFWMNSGKTVQAPVVAPAGNATVSPAAPQELPSPPSATPPIEHTSPPVAKSDKAVTAALSGFQPVEELEPKVVRVQP
jgi:hypothetical protein